MSELLLTSFTIGLLGSLHCIGMCGGLVSAVCLSRPTLWWPGLLSYQAGRIGGYVVLGVLGGLIGAGLQHSGWLPNAQQILALFAALVMILFALHLGGWMPDPVARLTAAFTRASGLSRWTRQAAEHHGLKPWAVLGLLNGFLPCGLVYAALALSLSAEYVEDAALIMLAFGLGTLPAMTATPALIRRLTPQLRGALLKLAAVVLIALAIFTVLRGPLHGEHQHATPAAGESASHHH
ncbi:MAG: sulfite exporter TauE/SafE family protein [Pseudomonadota bacterium]